MTCDDALLRAVLRLRLLWRQRGALLAFQRIPNRQALDARADTLADKLAKHGDDFSDEELKQTPMADPLNPELSLLTFEKLYSDPIKP